MGGLVQLTRLRGEINRVPAGQEPGVVELHLEPHQRVVSLDLREAAWCSPERKTVDWRWTAVIETRLGGED